MERRFKVDKRLRFFAALGLVSALGIGCGGGETSNSDDNNNNNVDPNSGTTGETNGETNNVDPNSGTNNVDPNNVVPEGEATFVKPAAETTYANGDLEIEIATTKDVESVELMLDGDESLNNFDGSTSYTWDTTAHDEGTYELTLSYELGGEAATSDDTRQVILDRTAPTMVSSTPEADAEEVRSDAPLTVVFDEALDPETVDAETVALSFSDDQTTDYTVALSDDGLTVTLDFDRATITTPYDATIAIDGVADLAGNTVAADIAYQVPAWIVESLDGIVALQSPDYAIVGGAEYLLGYRTGVQTDNVVVHKSDGAGNWPEVAAYPMDDVYGVATQAMDDRIYLAVIGSKASGNDVFKYIRMLRFDPVAETLTEGPQFLLSPDSDNGAIALHVVDDAGEARGVVATVNDSELQVRLFSDDGTMSLDANIFDQTANYVQDDSLSAFLRSDGFPEVIFRSCISAAEPCERTVLNRRRQTIAGWGGIGSLVTPSVPGVSDQCDEFVNFEALYVGDAPTLLFSTYGPCDVPVPEVRHLTGSDAGWDDFYADNVFDSMPDQDDERYSAHLALAESGEVFGLFAAKDRMLVARYGADSVEWLPPFAEDLITVFTHRFQNMRLFMSADDMPIVVFRVIAPTLVYRAN